MSIHFEQSTTFTFIHSAECIQIHVIGQDSEMDVNNFANSFESNQSTPLQKDCNAELPITSDDSKIFPTTSSFASSSKYDHSGFLLKEAPGNLTLSVSRKSARDGSRMDSSRYSMTLLTTAKRKCDFSTPSNAEMVGCRELPTFTSNIVESATHMTITRPLGTLMEFTAPSNQIKKSTQSRPNSPSSSQRVIATRSRIASIRRESDCSVENEAAHEKLVKTSQQVSLGFEDFCLDDKTFEERKRAKSLTEPISIFTNAFLIQSSSPSPTRNVDTQKQCYSPSTQQVVRNNIPYSPSPSPTPSSPTRGRIMRSMSPIAVRQISKRRYTGSGNGSGLESDSENSSSLPAKRACVTPRNAASPLVRDPLSGYQHDEPMSDDNRNLSYHPTSSTSTQSLRPSRFLDASFNRQQFCNSPNSVELEDISGTTELDHSYQSFCSNYLNDNSSTTFSSRAGTPIDEQLNGESSLNLTSGSSSHGSSVSRSEPFIRGRHLSAATAEDSTAMIFNSPAKLTSIFGGPNQTDINRSTSSPYQLLPFPTALIIEQQKSASSSPRSYCSSAASPLATGGMTAISAQTQSLSNLPVLLPARAIQSTSSSSGSSPQPPPSPSLSYIPTKSNLLLPSRIMGKKDDVQFYLNEPENAHSNSKKETTASKVVNPTNSTNS